MVTCAAFVASDTGLTLKPSFLAASADFPSRTPITT